MKYNFIMKHDFHDISFVFDDFDEGCTFMEEAMAHGDVSFRVEIFKEGKEVKDE